MGWDSWEDAAKKGPYRLFFKMLRFMLVVIVVSVFIVGVGGVFSWVARIASQPAKIVEKTLDADNVIYNYEWFKQTAEDMDVAERRIVITEQAVKDHKEGLPVDRTKWGFEDKEAYSRLTTDLRGQRAFFEQISADFRARSKMANRAIFKGDAKIIQWVDRVVGVAE